VATHLTARLTTARRRRRGVSSSDDDDESYDEESYDEDDDESYDEKEGSYHSIVLYPRPFWNDEDCSYQAHYSTNNIVNFIPCRCSLSNESCPEGSFYSHETGIMNFACAVYD
jgi:hypothetical protein